MAVAMATPARTMEAVDNPSYFTVPGDGKFSLLKRRGLGAGPPTRRHSHSRTLLRSVSAQSDASLLVLGNPRLCDLAPTHRPHDADGELLLGSDGDARYYNLPRRRHSFGEFMRVAPASSPSEPTTSSINCHSNRKRCDKCSEKVTKGSDLLDIVIVSSKGSEASALWVSYLTTCFQQVAKERSRLPFKLLSVSVEDVLSGVVPVSQHDSIFKARLQLVVLCPVFLESLSSSLAPAAMLGTLLQPGHVLAMLLGVSDDSVTNQHRTALVCYEKWQRQIVKDQDPMFVGDFLGTAMDILSRSWQLQQAISQIQKDENKAQFSVLPKKIKVGQNKLIILLFEPVEANDTILINIDKNGEKIEVPSFKKRNPYTLQFPVPASCLQVSMLITVMVEKNGKPMGHRLVKCESRMRELDQLLRSSDNPLQFMCQTLGLSPGDREQLDVFLAAAFQQNIPPHYNLLRPSGLRYHASGEEYPTLLHFAAQHGLEKLTWQLLECPGGEQATQIRNSCQLTPADMAERAGHTRLANTLKGFMQMTELSSMYNYLKGMSEKQANDSVLNFNCTNYLLPRPLNNTYSVPPAARPVLNTPPPNASQPSSPHPLSHQYTNLSSYQIPPSPVSIVGNFDYNIPSFPLPVHTPLDNYQVPGQAIPYHPPTPPTPSSPIDALLPCGYIDMQSPTNSVSGIGSANKLRQKMNLSLPHHEYHNCPSDFHGSLFYSTDDITSCQNSESRQRNSSHSSNSGKSSIVSAQDELAEIINDFKNNVFTIAEVEKLVESWQNRHDVQQSFIDKQKQLNEMREEYDKIQKTMKDSMKRATPFERIRKFFSRGKNKGCTGNCKNKPLSSVSSKSTTRTVTHRPASSLSLQSSCSSSSSGRLSSASGASLGDSGTHSDSDDKKTSEIAQKSLRSKLSSEKLYFEIPQKEIAIHLDESSKDKNKLLECLPISHGHGTSKSCFLHRSNSLIQENTIEEVDESSKSLQEQLLPDKDTLKTSIKEALETIVTINVDPSSKEYESKEENFNDFQSSRIPLPPCDISKANDMDCIIVPHNEHYENKLKVPEQLMIIEDSDNINKETILENTKSEIVIHEINTAELTLDKSTVIESYTQESSTDISGIDLTINTSSFSVFDEEEDACEHILEEAETEVVFEIPDYINVTSPPIPPRPICDNVSM